MDKRQAMIAGVIGLVAAGGGAWWFLQGSDEPAPAPAPVVTKTSAPAATPPAPVVAAAAGNAAPTPGAKPAAQESDAVALSEEEIDKVAQEKEDLAARAADLESQVQDGKMLLEMKQKQIKELEARLTTTSAKK